MCALGFLSGDRDRALALLPSRVTEKVKRGSGQEPLPARRLPGNVRNMVSVGPASACTILGNISVLPALMHAGHSQAPCTRYPGMLLVLATTQEVTSSWPISPRSRAASTSSSRACVGPICGMEVPSPRGGLPGCVGCWGPEAGTAMVVPCPAPGPAEVGGFGEEGCVQRHWSGRKWSQVLSLRSSPPPTVGPRRLLMQGRPQVQGSPQARCAARALGPSHS